VERSIDGVTFTQIATAPARNNTGGVTFVDVLVSLGTTYTYRVAAVNAGGSSAYSNLASITVSVPADPTNLSATAVRQGTNERVTLTWSDVATNESGYTVQRSADPTFNTGVTTTTLAAGTTTYITGNIARTTWYFRVRAFNALGTSAWVSVTVPPAP
jgi:predicted phage tail protein